MKTTERSSHNFIWGETVRDLLIKVSYLDQGDQGDQGVKVSRCQGDQGVKVSYAVSYLRFSRFNDGSGKRK